MAHKDKSGSGSFPVPSLPNGYQGTDLASSVHRGNILHVYPDQARHQHDPTVSMPSYRGRFLASSLFQECMEKLQYLLLYADSPEKFIRASACQYIQLIILLHCPALSPQCRCGASEHRPSESHEYSEYCLLSWL